MKKLEEIGKKDIFKVPDGYFEDLPTIIQSRVAEKDKTWVLSWLNGFKYALPVLAFVVTVLWFFKPTPSQSPEQILASINTEDIADYLSTMEINNDDLLEIIDYSRINPDSLSFEESRIITDDASIDLSDYLIDLETEI